VLHERVLNRWRWSAAGFAGGAGALVGSFAGWLLGLTPGAHFGLLLALALLAAGAARSLRPQRGGERALAWISERVGLAYETAWSLQHQRPPKAGLAEDLAAAVRVQGRLAIRDLQPPAVASWWLPLLSAAIGVWLWALVAGPPLPAPAGWSPVPASQPPNLGQPPLVASDELGAPEVTAAEAEADTSLAPTDERAAPSDSGAPPGGTGSEAPSGDGQAAERETFERFLERLRERSSTEPQPLASATAASDGEQGEDPPPTLPASDAGERRDPSDGPTAESPQGDAEADGAGEEAPVAGDPGPGEIDEASADGELGEGESPALGDALEPGGEAAGERDAPNEGSLSDEAAGLPEGGDAESQGGTGVGAPGSATTLDEASLTDPEPLPSLIGPGPEQAVGGVRLPGAPPADLTPEGAAPLEFQRAVERALLEGDLPAPYQEVIRSYFQ
jgi:hypothetical protein